MKQAKPLSEIMPVVIQQMGIKKQFVTESIFHHWPEIVGAEIASHTKPQQLQRDTLFVTVDTSVWAHHLTMMKEEIVARIQAFTKEKVVANIRFQAGYLRFSQNQEHTDPTEEAAPRIPLYRVQLDEEEVRYLQDTVQPVRDKFLKQRIMKLLRKDIAWKKVMKQHNWRRCATCTALCPPGETQCTACKVQRREQVIRDVMRLLREVPWLRYPEVGRQLSCSPQEYDTAQHLLINALARQIQFGDTDRLTVMSLIMLQTGAKPEAVNDAIISKTLEKIRRKSHVSTSGS